MNKAQAIRTKALDQHVMHKILASAALIVAFDPISADCQHFSAGLINRYDVRKLNSGRFAVFSNVLKARNVQIYVKFQQKDLFRRSGLHYTGLFVHGIRDLAGICRRFCRLNVQIQVLPGHNTLAEVVCVHGNAVRDPWALAHDA